MSWCSQAVESGEDDDDPIVVLLYLLWKWYHNRCQLHLRVIFFPQNLSPLVPSKWDPWMKTVSSFPGKPFSSLDTCLLVIDSFLKVKLITYVRITLSALRIAFFSPTRISHRMKPIELVSMHQSQRKLLRGFLKRCSLISTWIALVLLSAIKVTN